MSQTKLQGAMTALITPFRDGKIDEEVYAKLIQRQIDGGIDVVVPVGTTGESATLSHDEHKRCIEIAVEVCKGSGTKVLAGAGSNSTEEAVALTIYAQKCGADAVLSVAPYYNKPTQEGLYQHYKSVAESVDIPIMLYNVPGRTGVEISSQTLFRLFDDYKNIYAVKEASGSMERVVDILANRPELYLLSGDDTIDYPLLANGAKGVISVTANLLPDLKSSLVHKALEGDLRGSKEINDRLYSMNRTLFIESNPIPIKAAMYVVGLLKSLEYRLPLTPPSKESMKKIEEILKEYKIVGVK